MPKKIIFAGGGTGGHIYPAVAIATGIKADFPDTDILFIGTERGLEKDLVPKAGFELKTIRIKGFKRKLSLDTLSSIKELALGMVESRRIIAEEKPDLVIGTGGYVAGPVVLLAALSGVTTIIHEQNVKPGVTNKMLSRFVDKIAISFMESYEYFPRGKTILTGNPIRPEIAAGNRTEALSQFGLRSDLPVVLCFGGSQGASRLNDAVVELVPDIKDGGKYQLIHITGKGQYSKAKIALENKGIQLEDLGHIKILPYIYNMQDAYAAADLVISRAGALAVSEISMCGKPSILIPLHTAAGHHQDYNAKFLKDHGAAVIIQDKHLSGRVLKETIESIIFNRRCIEDMAESSQSLGKHDALETILHEIRNMMKP